VADPRPTLPATTVGELRERLTYLPEHLPVYVLTDPEARSEARLGQCDVGAVPPRVVLVLELTTQAKT